MTYTFDSAAYERFSDDNPALHELLLTYGIVLPPPAISPLAQVVASAKKKPKTTRAMTPVKTLTAIQATLHVDPADDRNIHVSFKLYSDRAYDFTKPAQHFTIPVTYTGSKFVGSAKGYTVELDEDDLINVHDGVNTIILPPISQNFSAGSGAKKAKTFLGQSRADLTGTRRDWPTGEASFI